MEVPDSQALPDRRERAALAIADRISVAIVRRDDEPADVCRWHRDLVDLVLDAADFDRLQVENERLRAGIVAIYRENAPLAAKACDEVIDRSGRLLGQVRTLARASDDKQPAPPEGLSVGREQECEHCYQDGRCLSEPCPRPPKYPRGYDEDAGREWDEWEALKATLPSPRQEAADGPC